MTSHIVQVWRASGAHGQQDFTTRGGVAARVACDIDIDGSGVKGALVDLETGEYVGDQARIPTPTPAAPDAVAAVRYEVIDQSDVKIGVPIGVTFPAPVFDGIIPYMANLDQSWVNVNVDELMGCYLGRAVVALNDADVAGIAEVAYGAARGRDSVIVFTTQGAGIGSATIVNGMLLINTELGHLEIDGTDTEKNASSGQKTLRGLNWEQWAQRLQRYYSHVELLLNPDLFVVGGGMSENHEKFVPLLDLKTLMTPARLLNTAGIAGAAYYAMQRSA